MVGNLFGLCHCQHHPFINRGVKNKLPFGVHLLDCPDMMRAADAYNNGVGGKRKLVQLAGIFTNNARVLGSGWFGIYGPDNAAVRVSISDDHLLISWGQVINTENARLKICLDER